MKLFRKRRNGYALLFAASICLAVWFGVTSMLEVVFVNGCVKMYKKGDQIMYRSGIRTWYYQVRCLKPEPSASSTLFVL